MKPKTKRRIALLFGGRGSEHLISCKSAASIARALTSECELYTVGITRSGDLYLFSGKLSDMEKGIWQEDADHLFPVSLLRRQGVGNLLCGDTLLPVDVALPALHGDFGEDGRIQGMLETVGIPFVGASTLGGAISASKARTKILAEHLSIPTVPWCMLAPSTPFSHAKMMLRARFGTREYPLILKPDALGSSIGICTVGSDEELRAALPKMAPHGDFLAEQYLPNVREIEVCFLDCPSEPLFVIGEVAYRRGGEGAIYSYEKKYSTDIPPFKHSPLTQRQQELLSHYARALVALVGLRDLARIDFFLDGDGNIYFNEINSFPGFTENSFYPQAMKSSGIDYKTLLFNLIERAYDRRI